MSSVNPNPTEAGLPLPAAPKNAQLPPGEGVWPLPHYLQHLTFINYLTRTYFWTHDEALRSGLCNADAMWADLVISTAIRDRQRPVLQLEHQLEPRNPTDQAEKMLADDLTEVLEDIPRFQEMKLALLESIWLGRSAVQVTCAWPKDVTYPRPRLLVRDWQPVHGDSLVFKFDGTPGVLCSPLLAGQPGVHMIEGRAGLVKILSPAEQEVFLVHEFEPMATPFHRHEMAGQVHGSGYRGRVYWLWWIKHNLMRLLMDFVRKTSGGFFLAGYEAGNRTEFTAMKTAMEEQAGQPVIYVPLGGTRQSLDQVLKHLPVSMQGADFQWQIIEAINQMIRDAILGQSMANKAAPAGLGGANAEHQGFTDDERVKYDAVSLEYPLQKLVNLLAKYMRPGVRPPRFQFLSDKRNPGEIMESVTFFAQMGGAVPKTWVQEQLGIPEPQGGEEVLGMVQNQQAVALAGEPAGVPQAGPAGPAPEGAEPTDADQAALEAQIQPLNS